MSVHQRIHFTKHRPGMARSGAHYAIVILVAILLFLLLSGAVVNQLEW